MALLKEHNMTTVIESVMLVELVLVKPLSIAVTPQTPELREPEINAAVMAPVFIPMNGGFVPYPMPGILFHR